MDERALRDALTNERHFAHAFGAYTLEVPGAHLLVDERVPVPRFNVVQDVRQAPARVAAFVERAFEHYYQRALRPTIELPCHLEQPALVRALEASGYRSEGPQRRHQVLARPAGPVPARPASAYTVRPAREDEVPLVGDLLVERRYQEEVLRSLDVAIHHPNPEERLTAWLAVHGEEVAAFGLLYAYRGHEGLHGVATRVGWRDQGAATELVGGVLAARSVGSGPLFLPTWGAGMPTRLRELGFAPVGAFDVYSLGGAPP